ncbi:hypothetical protein SHELI_v1c00740 [Spiroplasma helicoides]|uniref:Impact N-terminal domain-containing protein n=1 Tax=Spiroplasma helicoides TaxID=216938 RepID=A0A1B3SJC2_9MOLU|nr:YigZ family protein [Spiroplasma helicoides]AOG60029.1 hypothetical protein SHELI_v1c00740 [Spiroplasma helicoides]
MKVLSENTVYTFEETIKKSKFITYIATIKDKEQLEYFISKYRRKDARHNCWAYRIGNNIITAKYGYNNDGEPTGTAGEPLLKLIETNDLTNIVIFCVRYFGGIKLGTGGLQKAYSNGAITLLKEANTKQLELLYSVKIKFSITNIKMINNFLNTIKVFDYNQSFKEKEVFFEFKIDNIEKLNTILNIVEVVEKNRDFY